MTTTRAPAAGTLRGDEELLEQLLLEAVAAAEGPSGREAVARLTRLRALAASARHGDTEAAAALRRTAAGLPRREALVVAKALLMRLQAANVAEERERVRRLEAAPAQRATLLEALRGVEDPGLLRAHLDDLHVEIVLTMHPSDATRRAVIHKLLLVAEQLDDLDRARGDDARHRVRADLAETVAAWWATDEVRRSRPPVEEEVRRTVFLVESALYDAAADVAMELERRLGVELARPPVSFVQWAGGDMDGNPSTSAETVRFAVLEARRAALRLMRDRVVRASRLHSEGGRYAHLGALEQLIARDADELPGGALEATAYSHEPLRRKLRLIRDRLTWSLRALDDDVAVEPAWTYRDPARLVEDLEGVRAATDGPTPSLDRLVWQARIFGTQLLGIDVRLHATEIAEAVDLALPGAVGSSGAERERLIADALGRPPADRAALGSRAGTALAAAAALRDQFGTCPLRSLVVSGCEEPADVLGAALLLRLSDLDEVPAVPLFESGAALRGAAPIAKRLLAESAMRERIARAGGSLEVMLGHSDGGKEESLLGAQWRIWRAQEDLVRVCAAHGVGFRAFHGRGGSPARGAAPADEIAQAMPAGAARGGLRLTEQGEAARAKLAHPMLARRALEQVLSGALLAAGRSGEAEVPAAWRDEMDALADRSRATWRALLDDPDFPEAFRRTTPIGLADDLNLGSRPARRAGADAATLRAIPWVMAWTQTRVLVPAWYGAGTALAAGSAATQREMLAGWPAFRAMVSSLEAALFRTDLAFADDYRDLADGAAGADRIWGLIRAEHDRARSAVLSVTGDSELYGRRPGLRARLDQRNPWIDPLSALQVDLLARLEAGDEAVRQPLLTTMAGVAAGVQSVG
jgi:phosphoenolpyruvate carboxylase